MKTTSATRERPGRDPGPLIAELVRLRRAIREVGEQLDRIEIEMHQALNDAWRERFEECR